uniref:CCHC-type domain-containing protein n=2 Tax=Nothobranchius kadleci TaxID=1051664 RepID=A0A1A8BJI0_NOTKA
MSWVKLLPQTMSESSRQPANPADSTLSDLLQRMSQQEQTLPLLMDQLNAAHNRYQQLEALVRQIHERVTQPLPQTTRSEPQAAAPVASGPGVPVPTEMSHFRPAISPPSQTFSGEFEECHSFLLQCRLAFERSPGAFPTDSSKISYVIGLLRGRALRWAEAKSHCAAFLAGPFDEFLADFTLTFGQTESVSDIGKRLWNLSQGRRSVADMSVEFRTLAARTSWNEEALMAAFTEALSVRVRDQLALCPEPQSLEGLIRLAISIDKRHQELRRPASSARPAPIPDRNLGGHRSFSETPTADEPMQMGRTRLTPEEREHRLRSGLCLYCGQTGHFARACPALGKGRAHQ